MTVKVSILGFIVVTMGMLLGVTNVEAGQAGSSITIEASKRDVWEALATLDRLHEYDHRVVNSYYVGNLKEEVGAVRQCDFEKGHLIEEVIDWQENKKYTLAVTGPKVPKIIKPPLLVTFEISDGESYGETVTTMTGQYKVKGGPLGSVLGFMLKPMLKMKMKGHLKEFKEYVEAN